MRSGVGAQLGVAKVAAVAEHDAGDPVVSVIIPTYDRPDRVADAVASVIGQTMSDLECLVIDDGSPRPPLTDVVDPRVRVIRSAASTGAAAARNRGIEAARGRWIAFLDDDDLWSPERLERALTAVTDGVDVLVGDTIVLGPEAIDLSTIDRGAASVAPVAVEGPLLGRTTPHLSATLVRRSVCPRFDERYVGAEDIEWWIRASAGRTVHRQPSAEVAWRRHGETGRPNGLRTRIDGSLLVMSEHADYFARHPRARSFRLARVAHMSEVDGRLGDALRFAWRSFRVRPNLLAVSTFARVARSGVHRSASRRS